MKKLYIIIALTLVLQGCFFVVGAAAGAAAVAMVYDHRKVDNVLDDQRLANEVNNKIQGTQELRNNCHIDVTCFNHIILLTGEAPNPGWREQAENLARSVPGVSRVYNQISIEGPTSSLTRTSDSWITTKVKTEMLATKGLQSGTIKVITQNGVVYLMGIVSHEQADAAAEIARQVAGVRKVVKIFQYTDAIDLFPNLEQRDKVEEKMSEKPEFT
ncbi:MAG: hypothetical protein A3E83_02085 [Gammaproteobacteria bacterium RIFCSPHIGHO2_12_FULL_41_20]|nr:MAG: hypothetical protein A3E83_02085 [Gammaproteobacteria bacterium RIFCSPHIGHO2_12_FULL_41_20]